MNSFLANLKLSSPSPKLFIALAILISLFGYSKLLASVLGMSSNATKSFSALSQCEGFGFNYVRGFAPSPSTQERPISVVSGDFNKDGKADLVAANLFANSISVLIGLGDGDFSLPVNLPVVGDGRGSPAGLAVGDFNADGNLDLAIAIEYNPGRVFVMNGNGAGSFSVSSMLDAGVNTTAVTVSDFNGDGKVDIAAANKGEAPASRDISVFLNNGMGGYGSASTFAAGTTPIALIGGEFNGDTKNDLAVVNIGSNNLSILVGNGAGSFAAPAHHNVGTEPRGIVAGFFNNDARLDLAVTNLANDNVSILLANDMGTFAAAVNYATGITPAGIVSGDFNGDGKADLSVTNAFSNQASVLLNNGTGGFGAPNSYSVGSQPLSLAAGDFNGDAKMDLAVANSSSNNISILIGKGNGTFVGTTFLLSNPQAVLIEDFNKDGHDDVAVANFGSDKITMFLADGVGSYSIPKEFAVGIKPVALAAGEFNGDGKLDLAVANNGASDVSILLGDGMGCFAPHTTFSAALQPRSIAAVDFNNDDKLDLITANEGANNLTLMLGQGNGTFAAPVAFAVGMQPVALDVDDLNNDNNPDVVVANSNSTFVSVLLGNGMGGFTAAANLNLPGAVNGQSVAAADLNDDDKSDLVIAVKNANYLLVALGNGNGTFAAPTSIAIGGNNPTEIVVADFDGDAQADLAVANSANDFISLLQGNGDGTFNAAQTFKTGAGAVSLDVSDLNKDKRADLAVVNASSNNLAILLNICANTPPIITAAPALTRTQGGSAINSTIATISDLESAAGNLSFRAIAPVGVSVANITNINGTIKADISAPCATASGDKVITLEVEDENGLLAQTTIIVNVTANTAPALGDYANAEVVLIGSTSVLPTVAPSDNGTITSLTVTSAPAGFTGTLSANTMSGVVSIANAAPSGIYNLTITATDNCGATTTRMLQLKVATPVVITALDPASKVVGSGAFSLAVNGSGFTENSKVRWNGSERTTTFVSANKLTAEITADDVKAVGSVNLTVFDPAVGGQTSNAVAFSIINPTPVLTSISPNSAYIGDLSLVMTVTGANFINGSIVRWNGSDRATTFVSASELKATVLASDFASTGQANVTVFTPEPGGGASASALFTVNALTGYEADVSPRPDGNNDGRVNIADWVQVGRFASGIDRPQNSSEFQRADCAPLATNGDGQLGIIDWVQAGRFAVGLDPVVAAAGPSLPVSSLEAAALRRNAAAFEAAQPELTRIVRARNATFTRGELGAMPIEIDAQGNENGLSFTLNFDARQLLFSHVTAAPGWSLHVNSLDASTGRIGVMMVLSAGQNAANGKQTIATIFFAPLGGVESLSTQVLFDDRVFDRAIADDKATLLPSATYENAAINITGRGVTNVRAASYLGPDLASDSIASAFGTDLAATTNVANGESLPTSLAGTTVKITDSKGKVADAPLFFVSPTQVNYLLPAGLAEGVAQVSITNRAGVISRGSLMINAVAPALFSADATGKGVAAADVVYVRPDQSQSWMNVARYDAVANRIAASPIDVSGDPVYLILYGTGIRNRAAQNNVRVKIDGVDVIVEYAGAQGGFAGLDQINVKLPVSLQRRGLVKIELLVEDKPANQVEVLIQ